MKKIILVLIIFIACYFIYNLTIDKKVSYLTLGDILSKGTNEYGVSNNGYSNYIRDYLKDKNQNSIKFKEAEGASPLSISHSKGRDLKNYQIYGNSTQKTTGKNLFDIDKFL